MITTQQAASSTEQKPVQTKQTPEQAIALTVERLQEYRARYDHWALSYSGGKDSTALLTLVDHLIQTGVVPAPQSLNIFYADTRLEIPPLRQSALAVLRVMQEHGHRVRVTLPALDHRFFVYRLGYGVPSPKNHFRWCTPKMKVEPIHRAMEEIEVLLGMGRMEWNERYHKQRYQPYGEEVEVWDEDKQRFKKVFQPDEKFLMLTGIREGESAIRDKAITVACSRDGGECGQGRFLLETPASLADTAAPLIHWRVCNVWDWLTFHAPRLGYPTQLIAQIYGGEEARENNARTGCIGCPLVQEDHMLANVLKLPEYRYLVPLVRLASLYEELSQPHNRHGKDSKPLRKEQQSAKKVTRSEPLMGPLTLEARRYGLSVVLSIQKTINDEARCLKATPVSLINRQEYLRILELIETKTYPQGWTGDEPRADRIYHRTVTKDLAQRSWLELLEENEVQA